nr:hypothetical protein 13 [Balneolaceae bacterium]
MKKLILIFFITINLQPVFSQDLDRVKNKIEESQLHLNEALEILDEIQKPNYPDTLILSYKNNGVLVEWDPFEVESLEDNPVDLHFYAEEIHTAWQHSVNKYIDMHNTPVLPETGEYKVGTSNSNFKNLTWWAKMSVEGKDVTVPSVVRPDEEPGRSSKLITIATSEQEGSEYFRDDFYGGSITGFIYHEGRYRIYFQNRAIRDSNDHYTIEMVTSTDLENWSSPQKTNLQEDERLLTVDGEIQCWIAEGSDAYIWTDFDTYDGCQDRSHKVIDGWKIDGTLGPNYFNGEYMQLGRVRGWQSNEEGGWEDDLADYPLLEWYPVLEKAYKEQAPNFNPLRNLHDRRGISLHKGKGDTIWSEEIIADPENVELPGFLGWEYPDKKGIGDFYSSTFVDPERILVKVYWKENDRLIDRSTRKGEFEPMSPQRRFRFTGETTVIAAKLSGNKIEWVSFESVLPYDHFARLAHPDVTWATKPDRVEVGQFTQAANIMEKDGYIYLPFQYRDDVHYESANNVNGEGLIRHLTGIYIYRVPEEEFDSWFDNEN